jgi:hypothetical protein
MPKTYTPPAAFNDASEFIDVPMAPVCSGQIRAVGYDAETKTLAVTFVHGIGSIYQYPGVEPQVFADFMAAESKGKFFGAHVKHLPFKKYRAPALA